MYICIRYSYLEKDHGHTNMKHILDVGKQVMTSKTTDRIILLIRPKDSKSRFVRNDLNS